MSEKRSIGGMITETIKTIFYALLIAGAFRTILFQPFWIPSGSMKDTLLIGDFLFVNKMAYGYSYASCPKIQIASVGLDLDADDFCGWMRGDNTRIWGGEPKRGDVVVFRHPVNGEDYIKRVVGLPGDTVHMIDGVLNINGTAVKLEDANPFTEVKAPQGPQSNMPRCENAPVGQGGSCIKARQYETLPGGRRHTILNIGDFRSDNTRPITVPKGQYFFMGDNRDNSTDSRVAQSAGGVGLVNFEDLIGRADRIMFSSAGTSMLHFWTYRSDRWFKAID